MIRAGTNGHTKFNFPCGETQVKYTPHDSYVDYITVDWEYQNDAEVIEYLQIVDILKRKRIKFDLWLPYVPFSRQDRINNLNESFSLKVFCDLINSTNPDRVIICDPHSDVTPALLNNVCVRTQDTLFRPLFYGRKNFHLVSPDAGALKKIYKLASIVNPTSIIQASKHRNVETGEILGVRINWDEWLPEDEIENDEFIIVDDICDGGKTFIEIAKQLKYDYPKNKIILMVTHGFFTKGLEVFDGLIDEIYTYKERVK